MQLEACPQAKTSHGPRSDAGRAQVGGVICLPSRLQLRKTVISQFGASASPSAMTALSSSYDLTSTMFSSLGEGVVDWVDIHLNVLIPEGGDKRDLRGVGGGLRWVVAEGGGGV